MAANSAKALFHWFSVRSRFFESLTNIGEWLASKDKINLEAESGNRISWKSTYSLLIILV